MPTPQTLGIRLGDILSYDVAGTAFDARVANLRKVEWDSFKVNFFVIASPGLLERFPASFITAFHLPQARAGVMHELVRAYPNVLVVDITAIMEQVKRTMDQVTRAVEFVFLFTLAAGVVVLYAAIIASQDERLKEAAILRTLGGRRRQLLAAQAAEFLSLGAMAGLFAATGATALGWVLAEFVLKLPYVFNPWVWPLGIGAGALGVALAGLLGTRRVLDHPPLAALRRLA